MNTLFQNLLAQAKKLQSQQNSEWAYEHKALYDSFEAKIDHHYDHGSLTDEQFDELALTAFYDYLGELKCEH